MSETQYNRAKELYSQGKSLRAIAEELNINRKSLSKKLKKDGIIIRDPNKNNIPKSKRIHSVNESVFEIIDTEEKAYWLGFLYADGYVGDNRLELALQAKDLEHLVKFKEFMESEHVLEFKKNANAYRIGIGSKKICSDLTNLGCYKAKSLTLQFPSKDIVPEHLIHHFMRGYFDGDGCIIASKSLRFSVIGTNDFLDIYESYILQALNKEKPNKRYNEGQASSIKYSGNIQCEKIFDFLYKDATIYLDRKYTKFIAVLGANRKDSQDD